MGLSLIFLSLASQSLKVSLTSVHFAIWRVFPSIVSSKESTTTLYPFISLYLPSKTKLPSGTNNCLLNPFWVGNDYFYCSRSSSPPYTKSSLIYLMLLGPILNWAIISNLKSKVPVITFLMKVNLSLHNVILALDLMTKPLVNSFWKLSSNIMQTLASFWQDNSIVVLLKRKTWNL